jgi:outer membrane receptor for ferrienterochelin and colicin
MTCVANVSCVFGQGVLTGSIGDSVSFEPLAGAHVLLEGTDKATISDEFGNFRFTNVPHGLQRINITFIGYNPLSIPVAVRKDSAAFVNARMAVGDVRLQDVVITASNEQSINTLSPLDIKLRPINSSQEILRMVPGLFIAQHAGGGKAEQIFLRGFDIDHGTDINLEVDGLPVNMVSHAHGQGYSDLHFVIPELINYVDFNKGPYYADKGDFTTAGYVDFQTQNTLEKNFLKVEGGRFGTVRGVVGLRLRPSKNGRTSGYIASELFRTNGYVESPQQFYRFNVMSKLSTQIGEDDRITVGLTSFNSRWDASGQIPQRAVESGLITRFGSIDNTEGGETNRMNLYIKHIHEFDNGDYFTQQAYASSYGFNLFSNFTFYLNDPVNGDQIQQNESRMIYGYRGNYTTAGSLIGKAVRTEAGVGLRIDDVNDIILSHTVRREFLNDVKRGDIFESNINAYVNEVIDVTKNISVTAGLRFDNFQFRYNDKLTGTNNSTSKSIVSPKLNITYQVDSKTQFYLRSGFGFHSNDTRVVTEQNGINVIPRAFGIDVGANSKLTEKLLLNFALWRLDLEQEFVYVGDEGIVEPSGRTQREGIDLSLRYEISSWLFADTDLNFTLPRSKDEPEGNNYIPLAPTFSTIGGLTFMFKNGLDISFRYRYLADRAAKEDKSVVASGYILADAALNYSRPKFEIGVSAENLFNIEWNEAQFDTESRLKNEAGPVSEIHFTPGTPFFMKLKLSFFF